MSNRLGHLEKNRCYLAGLLCGLRMRQSGPLPCFMTDEDLDAVLFGAITPGHPNPRPPVQQQFAKGLDELHIVQMNNCSCSGYNGTLRI